MACDVDAVNRQLGRLSQQQANLDDAIRQLTRYCDGLNNAWSGDEVKYYNKTINDLKAKCAVVSADIESLSSDIAKAVEDILREEAEAASELSSGTG